MMRGLIISGVLGTVLAFAVPQDEAKVEQVAETPAVLAECNCENGGPCICEPGSCDCPSCVAHNQVEVVEQPVQQPEPVVQVVEKTVENDFDPGYLEDSIASLREELNGVKTQQMAMAATAALNQSKCEECLSEQEIRAIVKDEIEARLTIKTTSGATRTEQVKVVGGSSEFVINPGEVLTHIDDVPVSQGTSYVAGNNVIEPVLNGQYEAAVPRRVLQPTPVRIFRNNGFFGGSNCANGQCGL